MSLVPREAYGRASGVERAGDNLGALIGPLLAAVLVGSLGIRTTLVLAFFPGLLAAAGVGIGLAETAQSITVAFALPDRLRGNGFGLLGLVQSFGDLGATLVAGVLWSVWSAQVAFAYAAAWMVASTCAAVALRRPTRDRGARG
jgi:MFS family permease